MSDFEILRGASSNMADKALKDGQLLIGKEGDEITAIGMDYTENGTLKRAKFQKATKTTTTTTLLASGWSDNEYSFETRYPESEYNIEISLSENCTDAQMKAFSNAKMISDDTTNVIIARGVVPTIDIPIKLGLEEK